MIRDKLILREVEELHRQLHVTGRWVDVERAIGLCGLAVDRVPTLSRGMRAHYDPARAIIRVLADLRDVEQRFAVAHELGHHVLEHGERSCFDLGLVGGDAPMDELDLAPDFEQEAHAFARELLLPRKLFIEDLLAKRSPNELAPLYGISQLAIWIQYTKMRLPAAHRQRGRQPKGTPLDRRK